jgi:hypothetical protein
MSYTPPKAGGAFEHRGWDCPACGENVPFFRPYKARVSWRCVHCYGDTVVQNPVARVYGWTRVIVMGGTWVRGTLPTPALPANVEAPTPP